MKGDSILVETGIAALAFVGATILVAGLIVLAYAGWPKIRRSLKRRKHRR